jgi:hypothetical protein
VASSAIVLRAYFPRAVWLWSLTRAAGTSLFALAGTSPAQISVETRIHYVLLAVAVCFVDLWVRRERALLGNLGVSRVAMASIFVAAAVIGELALLLAFGIVR